MKNLSHNEFVKRVLKCNPHYPEKFLIMGVYKSGTESILVKTKYGECNVKAENLWRRGIMPSILSAIDKTNYFINQSKEVHGNKYDYSKVEYVDSRTKVIITCPIHGDWDIVPTSHLGGKGCRKCGYEKIQKDNLLDINILLEKANEIHKHKYSYGMDKYIGLHLTKLTITCPIHGEFTQTVHAHVIKKQGCLACSVEEAKHRAHSWDADNWKKAAITSKNFDSFKVYVVKLFNEEEEFYKVGRTFLEVSKRMFKIPYDYIIIKQFQGSPEEMVNLERDIKIKNKEFAYLPMRCFGGRYECYNEINYEL